MNTLYIYISKPKLTKNTFMSIADEIQATQGDANQLRSVIPYGWWKRRTRAVSEICKFLPGATMAKLKVSQQNLRNKADQTYISTRWPPVTVILPFVQHRGHFRTAYSLRLCCEGLPRLQSVKDAKISTICRFAEYQLEYYKL